MAVWKFADVLSDSKTGAEVHLYQLVDTVTGEVLDEEYVYQG